MRTAVLVPVCAWLLACAGSRHCSEPPPGIPLDREERTFEVSLRGATRDFRVFVRGEGPPVVIFHEIPGLSPATFRLARLVSDAGFRVYTPLLFGKPGGYAVARNSLRLCLFGREFDCWNAGSSGPIAGELRPLLDRIDEQHGCRGLGAIGMCFTGTLPLELVALGAPIRAAVVAQPALPFRHPAALAIPDGTLEKVKAAGVAVVATRFSADDISPRPRLERLERELGDGVTTIEIDSGPGNRWGLDESAHAVLTNELRDEPRHPTRHVLDAAISTFHRKLDRQEPSCATPPASSSSSPSSSRAPAPTSRPAPSAIRNNLAPSSPPSTASRATPSTVGT